MPRQVMWNGNSTVLRAATNPIGIEIKTPTTDAATVLITLSRRPLQVFQSAKQKMHMLIKFKMKTGKTS